MWWKAFLAYYCVYQVRDLYFYMCSYQRPLKNDDLR